jgi:hypothetical protein
MSFTRFSYDEARIAKQLQESTDPGRYMLNVPCMAPSYTDCPEIRLQKYGGNLRNVPFGHPIDIDSDLIGLTRKISRDCIKNKYPMGGAVFSNKVNAPINNNLTKQQTRVTHPVWMYRDLEQKKSQFLFFDPQANVCKPFENNLNTRLLEKDHYVPKVICPLDYYN